ITARLAGDTTRWRAALLHLDHFPHTPSTMEHETLYSLANYLGTFAMLAVLGYHFVAVNGKYMAKDGKAKA
ncbi:uncharacterized protein SCHCODRAFT_02504714, partial [Schizophyllum commune H4-8]